MRNRCSCERARIRIIQAMLHTDLPTRTVTLVLSEAEWRALRELEPDSVAWLQSQIRDRLAANAASSARREIAEDDEY